MAWNACKIPFFPFSEACSVFRRYVLRLVFYSQSDKTSIYAMLIILAVPGHLNLDTTSRWFEEDITATLSYSVHVFVVVVDAGYSLFRRSPGGGTSVHRLCWLKLLESCCCLCTVWDALFARASRRSKWKMLHACVSIQWNSLVSVATAPKN